MTKKIIIGIGIVAIALLGVGLGSAAITESTTLEDPFNDSMEEMVNISITDSNNQSIRSDATVAGSGNVSLQTVIEFGGEIVKTDTDTYSTSTGTELLTTTHSPQANGTYNVTTKVVSGNETLVDSLFYERVDGSSGTVAAGGSLNMSLIELVALLVLALGLGAVILGRDQ